MGTSTTIRTFVRKPIDDLEKVGNVQWLHAYERCKRRVGIAKEKSMVVVVDDGLWFISIAVIHNADH